MSSRVPPGFRFHPTEEELVDYYLRKKVQAKSIDLDVIQEVDIYKIEPWDLSGKCQVGSSEQNEWYFFSHKDKKYPTGTRTNRSTGAGFWKATGRDKPIYTNEHKLVGMRKTLVFYKGRAPNGHKSDWIMHEYRLESRNNLSFYKEEAWVVCRAFVKKCPNMMAQGPALLLHQDPSTWDLHEHMYPLPPPSINHVHRNSLLLHHDNNTTITTSTQGGLLRSKPEAVDLEFPAAAAAASSSSSSYNYTRFMQMPSLESPTAASSTPYNMQDHDHDHDHVNNDVAVLDNERTQQQQTDWRVFDKLVASQLSQDVGMQHPHDSALFLPKNSSSNPAWQINPCNIINDADLWIFFRKKDV